MPLYARVGPEVYEPHLPSIHHERERSFGCLVGRFVDYRSLSVQEFQVAINNSWHLEGPVTVLHQAGNFFILQVENLADHDDLRSGPWNINGALLLLRPWVADRPLHSIDFSTAALWIQISGAPLEYMTPTMAVRLVALLGTVVSVDRRTVDRENLEYMRVRVEIPILRPLISGALRLENGDPVWLHFSYERIFKACFKCGCVGHMPNHCHYSTAYTSTMIRERIQEAQQFPHSAFCQRALKAIKNSNLNRTSRLEILWSELETGAIETENALGIRTVFFMRQHNFSSSALLIALCRCENGLFWMMGKVLLKEQNMEKPLSLMQTPVTSLFSLIVGLTLTWSSPLLGSPLRLGLQLGS